MGGRREHFCGLLWGIHFPKEELEKEALAGLASYKPLSLFSPYKLLSLFTIFAFSGLFRTKERGGGRRESLETVRPQKFFKETEKPPQNSAKTVITFFHNLDVMNRLGAGGKIVVDC